MIEPSSQLVRHLQLQPLSTNPHLYMFTGMPGVGKRELVGRRFSTLPIFDLSILSQREFVRRVTASEWGEQIGPAILLNAHKEPVAIEKLQKAFQLGNLPQSVMVVSHLPSEDNPIWSLDESALSVAELWPLLASELGQQGQRLIKPPLLDAFIYADGTVGDVAKEIPPEVANNDEARGRQAIDHLLRWGGLPGLIGVTDEERKRLLTDHATNFPERDTQLTGRLRPIPFRHFRRLCAEHAGQHLSYTQITRMARINGRTGRRYVDFLEKLYQLYLLPTYETALTNELVKAPKIQMLDLGLWRQLTHYEGPTTPDMFRMLLIAEVFKWVRTAQRPAELANYRTLARMEVDLMVTTPAGVLGFKTTMSDEVQPSDWRSLNEVGQALEDRWRGGIVVYTGRKVQRIAPAIWAVPIERLLALPT